MMVRMNTFSDHDSMNYDADHLMGDNLIESHVETQKLSATHIAGLLFLLLTAGCGGVERTPPKTSAPQGATVVEPSQAHSINLSGTKTPAKVPAPAVSAERTRTPGASPPLDLTTLEKRLKETNAIGAFTKIALKNQVDDLLDQFRAYYQGRLKTTLAELRQPYDLLLLKVLSLLQDRDPSLASVIVASREAIWGILADPVKFATI